MRLFVFFLLFSSILNSQSGYTYEFIEKGTYSVGYKKWKIEDGSRPDISKSGKGRQIEIYVWYPAAISQSRYLDFQDYLAVGTKPNDFNQSDFFDWPLANGADKKEIDRFLSEPLKMWAQESPNVAEGQFPIVLMLHGYPASFSFMAEYLASHGLICVVVPTKGYFQNELEVSQIGLETQVRDYEYGLSAVKHKFNSSIDSALFLMGFSFGGQSALTFSLRNEVSGIVSLDGGIGSKFGFQLLQNSMFYNVEKLAVPLLHIYNPRDRHTYLTGVKTLIYSERELVAMNNVEHWTFTSFGKLNGMIANLFNPANYSSLTYESILYRCLTFIQPDQLNDQPGLKSPKQGTLYLDKIDN